MSNSITESFTFCTSCPKTKCLNLYAFRFKTIMYPYLEYKNDIKN